jgi:hypothetical protein
MWLLRRGKAVPAPIVTPVVLIMRWLITNKERTGLWLRQMEHIRGHLWHKYSVSFNFMVVACHLLQYVKIIVIASFIGRGTQRKPPICRKLYRICLVTNGNCS